MTKSTKSQLMTARSLKCAIDVPLMEFVTTMVFWPATKDLSENKMTVSKIFWSIIRRSASWRALKPNSSHRKVLRSVAKKSLVRSPSILSIRCFEMVLINSTQRMKKIARRLLKKFTSCLTRRLSLPLISSGETALQMNWMLKSLNLTARISHSSRSKRRSDLHVPSKCYLRSTSLTS